MSEANPLCLFWEGFELSGWSGYVDGRLLFRPSLARAGVIPSDDALRPTKPEPG